MKAQLAAIDELLAGSFDALGCVENTLHSAQQEITDLQKDKEQFEADNEPTKVDKQHPKKGLSSADVASPSDVCDDFEFANTVLETLKIAGIFADSLD